MNRSWPSIIAGTLIIMVLGLYMVTYQVRFNEVAVVRTFGKIRQPKLLFELDPSGQSTIDQGEISAGVRQAFADKGIELSENAEVSTKERGVAWLIADGDGSYLLQKEKGLLNVCEPMSRDVITEPGLKWKWPWPIQRVTIYDNRIQITNTTGEETPTRDGKNVILTTAIGWRIDDPYTFCIRCVNIADAENKLNTRVRNDQKTVIGQYDFSNFISIESDELRYDQIEKEILVSVQQSARELYGIRVESIGIAKLALPKRITEQVFDAMKKERQAVAAKYTSEGESRAKQITDTAEAIAGTIMDFADRKAAEIVSEGQRRAAQYHQVYSQDKELAMFLLKIENLAKILKERTTLVLDADQGLFDLLKENNSDGPTTRPASELGADGALKLPPPGMLKTE